MVMKTIVIFCRTVDPAGYPFNDEFYGEAYLDLLLTLKARGVQAYFAAGNETYLGDGRFSVVYDTDAKKPANEFEEVRDVRADLVFEKGGFTGSGVLVINPEFITHIAGNKILTYEHFKQYQPATVVCNT